MDITQKPGDKEHVERFFFIIIFYCISSDNSVLPDIPIDNVTYILGYLLSLYKLSLGVV